MKKVQASLSFDTIKDERVFWHISVLFEQAESRLAAKRAARAEAREIRIKEIEKQQKLVSINTLKVSNIL